MDSKQEDDNQARRDREALTDDPHTLHVISILEDEVEEAIGYASDGKL